MTIASLTGRHFLSFVPGMGERIEDYVIETRFGFRFDVIGLAIDRKQLVIQRLLSVARDAQGRPIYRHAVSPRFYELEHVRNDPDARAERRADREPPHPLSEDWHFHFHTITVEPITDLQEAFDVVTRAYDFDGRLDIDVERACKYGLPLIHRQPGLGEAIDRKIAEMFQGVRDD